MSYGSSLLWILHPISCSLCAECQDISALADGLLLDLAHSGKTDLLAVTRNCGPVWSLPYVNRFTRPGFQFVIYLAHFALGKDWASYPIINCFAAAGLAAVSFLIGTKRIGT